MADTVINYREVATFLKNTVLRNLSSFAESLSIPVIGDAYSFARPNSAAKAINLKISFLQDQINDVIATLSTLAAIDEIEADKLNVPPIFKAIMDREEKKVAFYVELFSKFNDEKQSLQTEQQQEPKQPVKKTSKKSTNGSKNKR